MENRTPKNRYNGSTAPDAGKTTEMSAKKCLKMMMMTRRD